MERPILFDAEMVRAILAGRKTQTRRIVQPQPGDEWHPASYGEVHKLRDGEFVFRNGEPVVIGWGPSNHDGGEAFPCPYGKPGDRLWVREAWGEHPEIEACTCYKADPGHKYDGIKWKPSIHMPRARCRMRLEVTDVRVERLQDISEEDAKAEGIEIIQGGFYKNYLGGEVAGCSSPELSFYSLWESINGIGSWDKNPWVWALTFRRFQP